MRKVLILFLCICIAGLPSLAGAADVERTLSTPAPEAGSAVDVTLSIQDITAGGVTEHLPPGFVFTGSSLPDDRVAVDEDRICFALINETSVSYQIVAPERGGGEITGEWYDFVNRHNGTIQPSPISVGEAGVADVGAATSPGPAPVLVIALLAGLVFSRGRRQ